MNLSISGKNGSMCNCWVLGDSEQQVSIRDFLSSAEFEANWYVVVIRGLRNYNDLIAQS